MLAQDGKRLFSLEQVLTDWLPISRSMLYSEIRKGRLRVTKLGRRSFVSRQDLEDYIAALQSN